MTISNADLVKSFLKLFLREDGRGRRQMLRSWVGESGHAEGALPKEAALDAKKSEAVKSYSMQSVLRARKTYGELKWVKSLIL